MSLKLSSTAPNFTQDSTFGVLNLYDYLGDSWGILFSHPKDFTPVCTTELGTVAKLSGEFEKRGVKVLALSVDSRESHEKWIQDINETQNTEVNFPIIADEDRSVADAYGMIHPEASNTLTVRSVFMIDPNKKVRLTLTYPAATGRNFEEILRAIDGLQLTDEHLVATPANWKNGDDVIILPSVQDKEELSARFPQGYQELRSYLRITAQPET
jgi:alkyl hydroperoxide reductase subunit AhpC